MSESTELKVARRGLYLMGGVFVLILLSGVIGSMHDFDYRVNIGCERIDCTAFVNAPSDYSDLNQPSDVEFGFRYQADMFDFGDCLAFHVCSEQAVEIVLRYRSTRSKFLGGADYETHYWRYSELNARGRKSAPPVLVQRAIVVRNGREILCSPARTLYPEDDPEHQVPRPSLSPRDMLVSLLDGRRF